MPQPVTQVPSCHSPLLTLPHVRSKPYRTRSPGDVGDPQQGPTPWRWAGSPRIRPGCPCSPPRPGGPSGSCGERLTTATHQQVAAAVIPLRHRSRSAVINELKHGSPNTSKAPSAGERPAGCLYRLAAFPDSPRETRSSLGRLYSGFWEARPTGSQRMT